MAFSAMIDVLFNDESIAKDAVYTPAGGVAQVDPVRVVRKRADVEVGMFDGRAVASTVVLDVRVSEVAAPGAGDTVTIGAQVYTVQGTPRRDELGLVWTLNTDGGA